jgi:hypothetical protein
MVCHFGVRLRGQSNPLPLGFFHASEIAVLSGSSPPRPSAVVMDQSVLCIYTTYIPRPEYQINGDNTGSLRRPIALRLYFSRFCRKHLHVMRALDLERDGPAAEARASSGENAAIHPSCCCLSLVIWEQQRV